jgi:hypothetical protein
MSQWGAGKGQEGNSFAEFSLYYRAPLETADSPNAILQVRISSKPWTSNTTSFSQVDLRPTVSAATLVTSPAGETQEIPVGKTVRVVNSGGQVQVTIDGEIRGPYDYVELRPGGTGASEGRVEIGLTPAVVRSSSA